MTYTVASDFHQNVAALDYIFENYADTQIVLLGDFFDTHDEKSVSDARDMADHLIQHWRAANVKPIIVTGNHDEFILATARGDNFMFQGWMANGGKKTLRQLGYHGAKNIHAVSEFLTQRWGGLLDVLRHGQPIVDDENIVFVHAGLNWDTADPIHQTSDDDAMWIREDYLFDHDDVHDGPHYNPTGKTIVSGHTPIQNFSRDKDDIWVMHHADDLPGVNRYLIDGGAGTGEPNAHVNIVQFDDHGRLIKQEAFGL